MYIFLNLILILSLISGVSLLEDKSQICENPFGTSYLKRELRVFATPRKLLEFIKPVKGRVTMGFGKNRHPFSGKTFIHKGIDFGAKRGTPVVASGNGIVTKVVKLVAKGKDGSRGKYIVIKHPEAYETLYSHLDSVSVARGDMVKMGDKIGEAGSTGLSTGNHLHFEIRKRGKPVNPSELLAR